MLKQSEPGASGQRSPDTVFVVHVDADADPEHAILTGRVEHVSSGHSGRFASFGEFLNFLSRALRNRRKGSRTHGEGR